MPNTYPGTTIEVTKLEKGSSKVLFAGVFATGGITLSQVSIMTGLEPYVIQNWVKRGFVSSPPKRLYTKEQFARIVIINMLRETLQLEQICELVRVIGGEPEDKSDDLISDDELYHRYVDMLAEKNFALIDGTSVYSAAERAAEDFVPTLPGAEKKLVRILQVMLYAHNASRLKASAIEIFSTLK